MLRGGRTMLASSQSRRVHTSTHHTHLLYTSTHLFLPPSPHRSLIRLVLVTSGDSPPTHVKYQKLHIYFFPPSFTSFFIFISPCIIVSLAACLDHNRAPDNHITRPDALQPRACRARNRCTLFLNVPSPLLHSPNTPLLSHFPSSPPFYSCRSFPAAA